MKEEEVSSESSNGSSDESSEDSGEGEDEGKSAVTTGGGMEQSRGVTRGRGVRGESSKNTKSERILL